MIVGVDASNLRSGGGVTHIVEILGAANPAEHGIERMIVWSGRETIRRIHPRPWLDLVHEPLLDGSIVSRSRWTSRQLTRLVRESCDLLFVPGGSYMGGFRPFVTMSRNMLPFDAGEIRRYGLSQKTLRLLYLHLVQRATFRAADGLIFLNDYARGVLTKLISPPEAKMRVIPHGVGRQFFQPPRPQPPLADFGPAQPVRLLYVSPVEPYKHQWHVAEAVSRLRAEGLPVCIDFIGAPFPSAHRRLLDVMRRLDPRKEFIHYRGWVPYEQLPYYYTNAQVFIFASSCENMPNVLLEAMASGLPIASSSHAPMPAVLGEFGEYFDPEQPEQIAAAVRKLILDQELRQRYAQGAFEKASTYSWERCADETLAFLADTARRVGTTR